MAVETAQEREHSVQAKLLNFRGQITSLSSHSAPTAVSNFHMFEAKRNRHCSIGRPVNHFLLLMTVHATAPRLARPCSSLRLAPMPVSRISTSIVSTINTLTCVCVSVCVSVYDGSGMFVGRD